LEEPSNIGKRILQILKEKGIKPTPFEERKEISRGYLDRAAKKGTGIGSEIVEILLEFPDVDAYWIITGQVLTGSNKENIASVGNNPEQWLSKDPDFLAGDPAVKEKVREATMMKIYLLEQDVIWRNKMIADKDKTIADLRERLTKAGIAYENEHDLPVKNP
jgi:hypothetical protein